MKDKSDKTGFDYVWTVILTTVETTSLRCNDFVTISSSQSVGLAIAQNTNNVHIKYLRSNLIPYLFINKFWFDGNDFFSKIL